MSKYVKVLNKEMCHKGYQYKEGVNIDTKVFDPNVKCDNGLYFTDIEHVMEWLKYDDIMGFYICDIEPMDTVVSEVCDMYKSHSINISNIREIRDVNTFKELMIKGADIFSPYSTCLQMACECGYFDVVKFLVESGSDIHANNEIAIRLATKCGHLDVVKYLTEKGADVHIRNNIIIRMASVYGYLDIIEYLIKRKEVSYEY